MYPTTANDKNSRNLSLLRFGEWVPGNGYGPWFISFYSAVSCAFGGVKCTQFNVSSAGNHAAIKFRSFSLLVLTSDVLISHPLREPLLPPPPPPHPLARWLIASFPQSEADGKEGGMS